MKRIVIFCILCLSSIACYGQQIKINTEFTLSLKSSGEGKYSYEITEAKTFNETLEFGNNALKDKVNDGEIKGIFSYVTMQGRSRKPYLVMKSGIPEQLKCKLTVSKSSTFLTKSELNIFLMPNVKRGDMWQDNIDQIKISDFAANEPLAFEIIE